MRFNEALYFAFVIGHRGDVSRVAWERDSKTKYNRISLGCHPSDEDDPNDYLIFGRTFTYTVLNDKLKDDITLAIRKRQFANNKYGLPITDEDLRAEDWKVDGLMYLGKRF